MDHGSNAPSVSSELTHLFKAGLAEPIAPIAQCRKTLSGAPFMDWISENWGSALHISPTKVDGIGHFSWLNMVKPAMFNSTPMFDGDFFSPPFLQIRLSYSQIIVVWLNPHVWIVEFPCQTRDFFGPFPPWKVTEIPTSCGSLHASISGQ